MGTGSTGLEEKRRAEYHTVLVFKIEGTKKC